MSSPLATLTTRDLTLAAGPRLLLAGVDLVLAPGARLGLVGPNGSGKTTLLRALAGRREADGGQIRLAPPTATVGYLPQESEPRPGETVRALLARRTGVTAASAQLDEATAALATDDPGAPERYNGALDRWMALGGPDLDARAAAVADDLGLPAGALDRELGRLSGGQAARAQLAALLLARFDVFLLDEPTNDLDVDGLERLERFVGGLDAPVMIVSHDRAFLERTVTGVAEIDEHHHTLTRYDGGWLAYLDERARAREHAAQDHRTYIARRDALVERARTQRQWASQGVRAAKRSGETDKFIRHRHVQSSQHVAAKARITDKALARLAPVDKPWEGWDLRLSIADAGRSGDVVARLSDAVVERPGVDGAPSFVLGPVSLEVSWGDRLAVVGRNGSGKSTLLDALLGRLPLTAGTQWRGPSVEIGEISQTRDLFAGAPSLLDGFHGASGVVDRSDARATLAKFGLTAAHVERAPESLSPGERTRATLAVLQARGVNVLVLDEPTNHLDLEAVEQLEQAVAAFTGTLLLVTHDRRMLEAVRIDRFVDVEDGRVTERR
ncbi:MAG: ABC-F family ATP-binding cassette domain-containing protein [Acidimicrobiales bacterium]|nr:ABC-F family ATP-binding cassette domain-containing protein [Acidimicrobiales bacterium]